MSELIIKFCHPNRDVRPPSPSPPPPLLIMIFMIFIIFLMQTIIKIRHPKRDFKIPFEVAKIPFELASQVQVEEIVFMAVRNCQASLLPPRALSKAAIAHCIIVSFCHIMAMVLPNWNASSGRALLPGPLCIVSTGVQNSEQQKKIWVTSLFDITLSNRWTIGQSCN